MMWWTGPGTAWGIAMMLGMLAFWALVIGGVVFVVTRLARARDRRDVAARGPEAILADRFAAGEIDEEEYRSRLAALRVHSMTGR